MHRKWRPRSSLLASRSSLNRTLGQWQAFARELLWVSAVINAFRTEANPENSADGRSLIEKMFSLETIAEATEAALQFHPAAEVFM